MNIAQYVLFNVEKFHATRCKQIILLKFNLRHHTDYEEISLRLVVSMRGSDLFIYINLK